MENYVYTGTPKTPIIKFDKNTGILEIEGRSIPENSIDFYKPLMDMLDDYRKAVKPNTVAEIKIEYLNTSSSKCILAVFKKLEEIKNADSHVLIKWYYQEDDDEMLEAGEEYQAVVNVQFKMIPVEV